MREAGDAGVVVASPPDLVYIQRDGQEVPLSDLLPRPAVPHPPPKVAAGGGGGHGEPPPPGRAGPRALGTTTPPARHLPEPGQAWVSLETVIGEIARDDGVTLAETALIGGDRAIHSLPSGKRITARLVDLPVEPLSDESGHGGSRTLGPLRCDPHGQRHLDYRTGVLELREEALDTFPLKGDR